MSFATTAKTATLLAATFFLVFAPATAAEASACKSGKVTALGNWSNTFAGARLSARLAWKEKAKAVHGSAYDTWWRSANKSYGCWSHNGRERCRAEARPCRFGL